MPSFPKTLTSLLSQIFFAAGVPVFFLAFCLVYDPFDAGVYLDMGRGLYTFNVIISTTIIFAVVALTRISLFFLRNRLDFDWLLYILWCIAELMICSLFLCLFLVLMYKGDYPFFDVLGESIRYCFLILIYPYLFFTLFVTLKDMLSARLDPSADDSRLMRFHDENNRLKLAVSSSNLLYISSEENYVRIFYSENGVTRDYLLRRSMRSLEPLFAKHGIIRCQRSYYVNPSKVKLIRREKEGVIFAVLDAEGVKDIPVSRTYYDDFVKALG